MLCRMTASFRATATRALFIPLRRATRISQFRADPFQPGGDVLGSIAEARIDSRREAREGVDHRQHPDLASRSELVMDEVHHPGGSRRPKIVTLDAKWKAVAYACAVRAVAERHVVSLTLCWSQVRHKFYELAQSSPAPIAAEALTRIATPYQGRGRYPRPPCRGSPRVRQASSRPVVASKSTPTWSNAPTEGRGWGTVATKQKRAVGMRAEFTLASFSYAD